MATPKIAQHTLENEQTVLEQTVLEQTVFEQTVFEQTKHDRIKLEKKRKTVETQITGSAANSARSRNAWST